MKIKVFRQPCNGEKIYPPIEISPGSKNFPTAVESLKIGEATIETTAKELKNSSLASLLNKAQIDSEGTISIKRTFSHVQSFEDINPNFLHLQLRSATGDVIGKTTLQRNQLPELISSLTG